MPTYDYRCEDNGQVVEVKHGMSENLNTWGGVCERAGIEPGDTPKGTPVRRLITGGQVVHSSSLSNPEAPVCRTGSCCPGGMCGLN